jgi:hypothetical protein
MAKRPPKKKAQVVGQNLAIALVQLTRVNEGTVAAIPLLWDAIMATSIQPPLMAYTFKFDGNNYNAKLSSHQWKIINAAISKKEDVVGTVVGLVSDLSQALSESACALVDTLTGQLPSTDEIGTKSPMGCCTFDGQKEPLTQLQCSQYTMSSWNGNDPTCSGDPDSGG